jgi:hypothetical protein
MFQFLVLTLQCMYCTAVIPVTSTSILGAGWLNSKFRSMDVKKPCYVFLCKAFHLSCRNVCRSSHKHWMHFWKGLQLFLPRCLVCLVKWMFLTISFCQLKSQAFLSPEVPVHSIFGPWLYAVLHKYILKVTSRAVLPIYTFTRSSEERDASPIHLQSSSWLKKVLWSYEITHFSTSYKSYSMTHCLPTPILSLCTRHLNQSKTICKRRHFLW